MKEIITNQTFDEERALYNIKEKEIVNCSFAGPADGESALKECKDFTVKNCSFSLRYPIWHAKNFSLISSKMDKFTRAPLWYCSKGYLYKNNIEGVKCLRECSDIEIKNCHIKSKEFGWKCKNIKISNSFFEAVYFLFESKNIEIDNIEMKGKYSFQYTKNLHINKSTLDTKDAFWHSKNVTVKDSVLNGEYLGWFSENLTLINCKISGTQPFCYCKNLKLINCTMENTDLAFEYSDVNAEIKGNILSVKNPKSGIIKADNIKTIIKENAAKHCDCKIIIND